MIVKLTFWSLVGLCSTMLTLVVFGLIGRSDTYVWLWGTDAIINSFVSVVLFEKPDGINSRWEEAKSVWTLGYSKSMGWSKKILLTSKDGI